LRAGSGRQAEIVRDADSAPGRKFPETKIGLGCVQAVSMSVRPAAKTGWKGESLRAASDERDCVLTGIAMFAVAFSAPAGPGGFGSGFSLLLPVLMIGVVYLMMIRPQQKKQKVWTEMLSQLKTGDRITTTGGIRGTIISLKDDALILRVAPDGIKMEVVKSAIASVTAQEEGSK
jgi:preprotein translocase subunit YajC